MSGAERVRINKRESRLKAKSKAINYTEIRTAKADGKLYYRLNPKTGRYDHNGLEWLKKWSERKSSEYGVKFQNAILEMKYLEDDDDIYDETNDYEAELPVDKDSWLPKDDEQAEIDELPEGSAERARKEKQLFLVWKKRQMKKNASIKARNKILDERMSLHVKANDHSSKARLKMVGDLENDMDMTARSRVHKWVWNVTDEDVENLGYDSVEEFHDDGQYATTMVEARKKADYLFIFRAVRASIIAAHAEATNSNKLIDDQERIRGRIKAFKHRPGMDLIEAADILQDLFDEGEIFGLSLSENEKRNYFMNMLDKELFKDDLKDYFDPRTADKFENTFEGLTEQMIEKFELLPRTDPEALRKWNRGGDRYFSKRESSFHAKEGGRGDNKSKKGGHNNDADSGQKSKDLTCWKCGFEGHVARFCRTPRDQWKTSDEEQSQPKPGTSNTKSKSKPEKSTNKSEVSNICVMSNDLNIDSEQVCCKATQLTMYRASRRGVKENQVDFILDTGTDTGVIQPDDRYLLRDIEQENVLIKGVTGSGVSKEVGNIGRDLFGQARVYDDYKGSIIISQYRIEHMYQLLNPVKGGPIILRGWPGTQWVGIEWTFIRDYDRYGDNLLHCTILKSVAKSFSAKVKSFYNPPEAPGESDIPDDVKPRLALVEIYHRKRGHPFPDEMVRQIEAANGKFDITVEDVELWRTYRHGFCTGCVAGAMKEHKRIKSTKPIVATYPGEVGAADIMFVEGSKSEKDPLLIHVDVYSDLLIGVQMHDRTKRSCLEAIKEVATKHKLWGWKLKELVFDRESAIVALECEIEDMEILLTLKAAGQKVGIAEAKIGFIRKRARGTKAGVRDRWGYLPADQFNMDLVLYIIQEINRSPRKGMDKTPWEIFTGRGIDYLRDFRVAWGEPVIVKRPKRVSADLRYAGEWAIVIRPIMNGTGVVKVFLLSSKRYAYRLNLKKVEGLPDWAIDILNSLSSNSVIGFEDEEENPEGIVYDEIERVVRLSAVEEASQENNFIPVVQEALENLAEGSNSFDTETLGEDFNDARPMVEEVRNESSSDTEHYLFETGDDVASVISDSEDDKDSYTYSDGHGVQTRSAVKDRERLELERDAERYAEYVAMGWRKPELGDEELAVFDRKHRRTETNLAKAREQLRSAYLKRFGGDNVVEETVNMLLEETVYILYEQAKKLRPQEAKDALHKEVKSACDKSIWHGVHERDLTPDQVKLILPMMKNYVEKYKPTGEFDKSKVRVLMRGDLQYDIGETEGPVARIESIFILINIAIFLDLELVKTDISTAYMNTPMEGSGVKHRWILLDRDVVEILLEIDREYWVKFVRGDGRILVEMDKLMYGFKEAAHYWHLVLIAVFIKHGYKQLFKDSCVVVKRGDDGRLSICAITVDDCLFGLTRHDGWRDEQIKMLRDAFENITVGLGDEQEIVGMHVKMDRVNKRACVSQRHYAEKVAEKIGISKGARTPATQDLFAEDQREFMSLNSYNMYGAKRTYPECLPSCVTLASKYNKATVKDMIKARRVAEYIYGTREDHCLVLSPKSLQIVATSDASYGETATAHSQTGGTVGFESDTGCWFSFISCKQPFITQSAGEAELVAVNTVGNHADWAIQLMEELGFEQKGIVIYQDSECSLKMLKKGTGSLKRAKHIKVRWFWLKELVDTGIVILKWMSGLVLVADLLTKPITGSRFKQLRKLLLGWDTDDQPLPEEVC